MTRKILHLDLDAFFCAVEEQRDPSLRGKPFAVGGKPDQRGVVASCSYAARMFGVHSVQPMRTAVRLCPDLLVVSRRHGDYSDVSRKVMALLREFTPLLEQLSIDEAFLDVSELSSSASEIAQAIQAKIRIELKLPCSLGVATNKLVAKIANNVGKAANKSAGYPNSIQVVRPGQEADFLAPLPVEELWGIGPKTGARLNQEYGIETIGALALEAPAKLEGRFGKMGRAMAAHALGIDEREVVTSREAKSISQEETFLQDVRDRATLDRTLRVQSAKVAKRLRKSKLVALTIKLKIRFSSFETISRQSTLQYPTDNEEVIFESAKSLLEKNWDNTQKVRLLGVGVTGLGAPVRQLSLWDVGSARRQKLQTAVDELQARFGPGIVKRGDEL